MLSENKKKEFLSPFHFGTQAVAAQVFEVCQRPLVFSAGPLLLLRPQPSLAQFADPPDSAHQPPWPCASPCGAHTGPDPQLLQCPWRTQLVPPPTLSSASVPYTPRQRRLHRPIKAERSCLARPALRFAVCRVLPRSPAPTKPPPPAVLDPPAMEPTGANRRRREACDTPPDVHRPSLAPGGHLCAAVAWKAEPAERDLPPPSDYSRLPSPFAPVSIPLYSPRPPLFSPHSIEPLGA
jgi:hypothetical protein